MAMTLNTLSQRLGGSPAPSFLNRVETGKVEPTRRLAERLAVALDLPTDVFLNAAGFATTRQEDTALETLRDMLGDDAPVMMMIPVVDRYEPDRVTGERRQRMLTRSETVRIVDLDSPDNEPFIGEVIYSLDREAEDGNGVVVLADGKLSAWLYRSTKKGAFIENGRGERRGSGYQIQGVILRVVRETILAE